jgi:membrane protein implicated in regulation of membrane protease activity
MYEEFERDLGLAGGNAIDSKIISNPRSDIKEFLRYAAMLGVIGIFIPLMFLIVSTESPVWILGDSAILWSQIVTLAASAVLSGLLIWSLFGFLRKSMT